MLVYLMRLKVPCPLFCIGCKSESRADAPSQTCMVAVGKAYMLTSEVLTQVIMQLWVAKQAGCSGSDGLLDLRLSARAGYWQNWQSPIRRRSCATFTTSTLRTLRGGA